MTSEVKDPELIAKNECIGALFSGVTGSDPYLNDNMRSAIECWIAEEGGDPKSLEIFVQKAVELALSKGVNLDNFNMFQVNLRERPYEPLFIRKELIDGLKPMTGAPQSLLVISGLKEAVTRALPKRKRKSTAESAMAEAEHYIDALGARFTANGCRLKILYLD